MNSTFARPNRTQVSAVARTALTCLIGAAVMTAAAKVQIPFWPVPMTLHTMAVVAFAVAFGPRLAVSIFVTYLAAGAMGLPVFSGSPERGIGIAYMVGPTGGYLLGYLIASGLISALAAGKGVVGRTLAMLIGMVPVYGLGMAWLALYVPTSQLFAVAVAPFLLGDLVKIALVAALSLVIPTTLLRGKP